MKKKELRKEIADLRMRVLALESRIQMLEFSNAARRYNDGWTKDPKKDTWRTPMWDDDDIWGFEITCSGE